jgi:hypothetical protein
MYCRGLKMGDMALWISQRAGEVKHQKKKSLLGFVLEPFHVV